MRKTTFSIYLLSLALSGCGLDYEAERRLLADNRRIECTLDEKTAWPPITKKNIYIQESILWLFTATQREKRNQGVDSYLRWGQVHSSDVVKFLLANNLQSLEVDKRWVGTGVVSKDVFGHEFSADLYRVYVAKEGDPYCKNYYQQYKYKMQSLPDMRRLGVGPDSCIAIKEIKEPAAEIRIVADLVPKEQAKAVRAMVSALDYSDPQRPVTLAKSSAMFTVDTPHGKYGSGDHFAHCGSSIETFNTIKAAIWSDRDSSGNTHRLVENLSLEEFNSPPRNGSDSDADKFVAWAGREMILNDSFDSTGAIWAGDLYREQATGAINLSGKAINVFSEGRVLSRQLVFPESWGWAHVYKIARQGRKIHVAVVNRVREETEQHLWITLDEGLRQLDSVQFSKTDLDRASTRLSAGKDSSAQAAATGH